MQEDLGLITTEEIQNLIYTIRGRQVMMDSDVAMLYNTETRKINQTVKRNVERFSEDFCFKLNVNELEEMRSQFVIASKKIDKYRNIRYQPYVFTERGASIKDLGKKCFGINKIEDERFLKEIVSNI